MRAGSFGTAVRQRRPPLRGHGEVPRFRWDDDRAYEALRAGVPAILTGACPLVSRLSGWSLARLASLIGDADSAEWPVHFTPPGVSRVNRTYGPGVGVGGVREMSFRSFASTLAEARHGGTTDGECGEEPYKHYHHYLQVLLVWACGGGRHARRPGLGALEAELDGIGWDWLREAAEVAGEGGFEACQLWCSHGGVATPRLSSSA